MGRPVMEDARAALVRGEMIMHHTYFWEEFIDEGGRLRGRVVKHFTLDIKPGGTQSSLCVTARASTTLCACDHVKAIKCKLLCERPSVWDMCGRVCVRG